MYITIFESQEFARWCSEDINNYKESIIKRAEMLLQSVTSNRKDLKYFSVGESMLESFMQHIELHHDVMAESTRVFNSCLTNQCITIVYDDIILEHECKNRGINIKHVIFFFNKLCNFITDSAILEWRLQRNICNPCVKVKHPKIEKAGFFPISYNLNDFILMMQKLTGKIIYFTPEEHKSVRVTKDGILCTFPTNRLESEYIIQQQLFDLYLNQKNFKQVNKYYFKDEENWGINDENIEIALHIMLQSILCELVLSEVYPAYNNKIVYGLLQFRCSDEFKSPTAKYLCAASKNKCLCKTCSGIEEIFNQEDNCPLYSKNTILGRKLRIDECDTPEKQQKLVDELLEKLSQ